MTILFLSIVGEHKKLKWSIQISHFYYILGVTRRSFLSKSPEIAGFWRSEVQHISSRDSLLPASFPVLWQAVQTEDVDPSTHSHLPLLISLPRFLFFLLLLLLCFCASSLLLLLTFCRLSPIPSRMLSFLLSPLSLLSLLFLLLPLMKHSHHFIENQKFRMQQADNLPFVYQSFRDMVISRNATCYNYKEWRQRWKLSFSRGWTKKSCGCWGCVT